MKWVSVRCAHGTLLTSSATAQQARQTRPKPAELPEVRALRAMVQELSESIAPLRTALESIQAENEQLRTRLADSRQETEQLRDQLAQLAQPQPPAVSFSDATAELGTLPEQARDSDLGTEVGDAA